MKKTLAIDFDGVIHDYPLGWHDGTIYGNPVPGVREALKALSETFIIVVFTARPQISDICLWMSNNDLYFDEITNTKPKAIAYIDDRAIRFTSWENTLVSLMNYGIFYDLVKTESQ